MFQNRRISFIVGASVAALLLLLQLFEATSIIGNGWSNVGPMEANDLRRVSWILFIVAECLILAAGIVGAALMVGKDGQEGGKLAERIPLNLYGRVYNYLFFLPPLMWLLAVLGEWLAISEQLAEANPFIMDYTVMITHAGLYIALALVIAAPLVGRFKRIRKDDAAQSVGAEAAAQE